MNALLNRTYGYVKNVSTSSSDALPTMSVRKNIDSDDIVANEASSETSNSFRKKAIRLVRPLRHSATTGQAYLPFVLLQQWEGRVTKSLGNSFVAILEDKTSPDNAPEEVEIEFDEISPEDKNLARPGAFFYWSVGYEQGPGVPRQRVSRIRFRRLPGWTTREVAVAKKNAEQFADIF